MGPWPPPSFRREGRRQVTGFLVICLLVPALAGYGYLILRGYMLDNNASYDAYKLLSVFYPGILAAACYWVTLEQPGWARVGGLAGRDGRRCEWIHFERDVYIFCAASLRTFNGDARPCAAWRI